MREIIRVVRAQRKNRAVKRRDLAMRRHGDCAVENGGRRGGRGGGGA